MDSLVWLAVDKHERIGELIGKGMGSGLEEQKATGEDKLS